MKMRAKSILVRSSRKSPDPSLASLPDDEANENLCSGVSTTHCDTDDVEIVPDTFDERDVPHKKRHCLGTTSETTDRGVSVDPPVLNLDACIVCEVADDRVSRCCGIDCLLSFHGECLYTDLGDSSEDLANPFCPYCWLKILALKSKTLKEKTVEAEKAVFRYLDKEVKSKVENDFDMSNGEKTPLIEETDQLDDDQGEVGTDKVTEEVVGASEEEERVATTENFQDAENDETAKDQTTRVRTGAGQKLDVLPFLSMQESFSGKEQDQVKQNEKQRGRRRREVGASEEEERVATENFQDAENDKNDETAIDHTRVRTVAGEKVDVSPFLSTQQSFSGKEQGQAKQNEKRRRRRGIELNTIDCEMSSKGSSDERNGDDEIEQVTSSAQVTSPSGNTKNQQATTLVVAKSKTVRDISFFKKDQRRRLFWTFEEEEMLKVGVEKFAAEAKKNMPWRKILEMGEKVFDETRTPADLKDKWRNMVKMNKTTL
ncbi:PREDICTED: transcriptional regulator ATRX [Camelina sativa]|uniref:Transcriptional regulator ATRX n=1 Tax=Camelina sativa TaxID=90675 RepID=A0ABM0V7U5_CAMSA|nr:PREDICTED: transcriptional regulator ATRX [Camelina sativa]